MGRSRLRAHCSKTGCKVLVPLANALRFPRGGGLPFYCKKHEKEILAEQAMGTVPFRAFVPVNLEPRTQVILRQLMRKPKCKLDGAGYIYALELRDRTHPDLVQIKVGRSSDVARRLREHRRRCPSARHILLGRSGLVSHCDRLERLIHIELTDRAAQCYPAGRAALRTKCADCNSVHTEIFTFRRLEGLNRGREWPLVLRPIVKRWAQFVKYHVV